MPFVAFYVTFPDQATAQAVANTLLAKRLIACANFFPIHAAYWWAGQQASEQEWAALFKTRLDLEEVLEHEIRQLHPYTVPCVARWEMRANADYEAWITNETVLADEGC